jgi:hypothetical protein
MEIQNEHPEGAAALERLRKVHRRMAAAKALGISECVLRGCQADDEAKAAWREMAMHEWRIEPKQTWEAGR